MSNCREREGGKERERASKEKLLPCFVICLRSFSFHLQLQLPLQLKWQQQRAPYEACTRTAWFPQVPKWVTVYRPRPPPHTPHPLPLATPTWARISYFHIFAWPFATVFPAWQVEEPSPVGPGESTSVGVRIRPWIGIYFGFCAHKMHVADLDGFLGLFVVAPLQRCSFSCSCSCSCRWRCRYSGRYICEYRCVRVCIYVFDTLIVCLAHCLRPRDLFATWTLYEYFQLTANLTRIYRLPPDCQQTWQKSRRVFW